MTAGADRELPLPPYRHRPGRTPHPERDPEGHRFLERLPAGFLPAGPVPLAALPEAALFRYGEQLFRAAYWWEAHAVWEELWRAAPPEGPERAALRALIQLAAAALKRDLGSPDGSRKLLDAACRNLRRAGGDGEGDAAAALRARFESLRRAAGLPSGPLPPCHSPPPATRTSRSSS